MKRWNAPVQNRGADGRGRMKAPRNGKPIHLTFCHWISIFSLFTSSGHFGNKSLVLVMHQISAGNSSWEFELLCFFAMSHASSWVVVLMVWQLLFSSSRIHLSGRVPNTLSCLVSVLQMQRNLSAWLTKAMRRIVLASFHDLLPPVFSLKFLLRRDGRHIFDFFKTLSLNDISPPVLV
jgi:hypothetical protein